MYLIYVLIVLIYVSFFGAIAVPNTILLGTIIPIVYLELKRKSEFKIPILFMLLGIALSILSCYFNREQSLLDTFRGSANYLYLLSYFVFQKLDYSIKTVEKALTFLVIVFCISYIIQFLVYPTVIFQGAGKDYDTVDLRIRIGAMGLGSLGLFYSLNKIILRNKNSLFFAGLLILCLIVVVLMGFRSMMLGILIGVLYMLIKIKGFSWKLVQYTLVALVFLFVVYHIPIISEKMDSMVKRQVENDQNFSNKDYVRIVQFDYFTSDYFENNTEIILGSGMPFEGSDYYEFTMNNQQKGLFWVDWGLIGLSWMLGIITVGSMLWYSIKAIRLKVPNNYCYFGTWFLYLLVISFFTAEFYRPGNFVIQAFVLYSINKIIIIKKIQSKLI